MELFSRVLGEISPHTLVWRHTKAHFHSIVTQMPVASSRSSAFPERKTTPPPLLCYLCQRPLVFYFEVTSGQKVINFWCLSRRRISWWNRWKTAICDDLSWRLFLDRVIRRWAGRCVQEETDPFLRLVGVLWLDRTSKLPEYTQRLAGLSALAHCRYSWSGSEVDTRWVQYVIFRMW